MQWTILSDLSAPLLESPVRSSASDLVPLGNGQAHCRLCGQVFASLQVGKSHLKNVHFPQAVQCSLCEQVINSVLSFRVHISRRHGIKGQRNILENYGRILD